ncbi:hypothetical protein [Streptomyces sp. KCTC 0041BP]|nr:hypothetical protein [Streptomyces sp. KCTC 0041BP]
MSSPAVKKGARGIESVAMMLREAKAHEAAEKQLADTLLKTYQEPGHQ